MGAISGICYWDGRAVRQEDLARLAEVCHIGGPDATRSVAPAPGVTLQAHALHFDKLSATERQPAVLSNGSILTWDGRLDNREDLLTCLHRDLGERQSDVDLVAAAYARWGKDAFPRLIGDWSLALWDAAEREIVLARDAMGNRPLYYLEVPGGFAWASILDALAECFDLYSRPSDAYIAGTLTLGVPPEVTHFEGARALPAGHLLAATERSISVRRYWKFLPKTIRYRNPQEYADHLRELFTRAVRVRLRADRTVWAHLSGGWDSSSVVCLANSLVRRGSVEATSLQPISTVSTASPESDENTFIHAVERWCELSSIRREYGGMALFSELLGYRRPYPWVPRLSLESMVQAAGDHIVLTGRFGDLITGRSGLMRIGMLEPLHEGRPLDTLRLAASRTREKRQRLLVTLLRLGSAAYMPFEWQRLREERARYARRALDQRVPVRDLAGIFGVLPAVLARAPRQPTLREPSVLDFPILKRALANQIYRMADAEQLGSSDQLPDVWLTSAYAHRPLIEYVLAVPLLTIWQPTVARAGFRHALADVLPPEVLNRTTKGDPNAAMARAGRECVTDLKKAGLFDGTMPINWQLVTRGYVDYARLGRTLQNTELGAQPSFFLRNCLYLEAWLQTLSTSKPQLQSRKGRSTGDRALRKGASTRVGWTWDHQSGTAG